MCGATGCSGRSAPDVTPTAIVVRSVIRALGTPPGSRPTRTVEGAVVSEEDSGPYMKPGATRGDGYEVDQYYEVDRGLIEPTAAWYVNRLSHDGWSVKRTDPPVLTGNAGAIRISGQRAKNILDVELRLTSAGAGRRLPSGANPTTTVGDADLVGWIEVSVSRDVG